VKRPDPIIERRSSGGTSYFLSGSFNKGEDQIRGMEKARDGGTGNWGK